jgi:hypothetical protein
MYMGRREMHTGLWWGKLIETDNLEDLVIDRDNIKIHFKGNRMDGPD